MTLKEAVNTYLATAGGYGQRMPLSGFALAPEPLREMISAWEEDYQLSRHYELIPASYRDLETPTYVIEGLEYSGIIFHASIAEVLGS